MGQGQETKIRNEPQVEIQERGEIFFFYRPKIGKDEAHSVDDVQRLYLVLRPESGERLVEEKQDPKSGKEGAKSKETDSASEGEYDTSTRGHRHSSPARAVGEGIYRILRHNPGKRMHTHLIYKLEFPPKDREHQPQEALNIEQEASFIIQIKNPDQHGSSSHYRGLQNKRKAVFPAHLQGQFRQKGFFPADPPDFLNYEGCEFLLISASDDIEGELGLELNTEEGEAEADADADADADASCSDLIKTFGETVSTSALLEGTWV